MAPPTRIAGERVVVLSGLDAGRHGRVTAPIPGHDLDGCVIVLLDPEPGRPDIGGLGPLGRGSRGGVRRCLPNEALVDETSRVEIPIPAATATIKAEHDRALVACERTLCDALASIGACVQVGIPVPQEQQDCIHRLFQVLGFIRGGA